jgi:hypothetical protein
VVVLLGTAIQLAVPAEPLPESRQASVHSGGGAGGVQDGHVHDAGVGVGDRPSGLSPRLAQTVVSGVDHVLSRSARREAHPLRGYAPAAVHGHTRAEPVAPLRYTGDPRIVLGERGNRIELAGRP